MSDETQAGRLALVRDFVNTLDVETGTDEIEGWLASHGATRVASRADVARAQDLREALRELMVANADGPSSPAAWQALDRQALRSRIGVRFDEGRESLRPDAGGVDGPLGETLAIVAASMADGSWTRLKACLADDCGWAFLDRSRNGSRRWCDMRVCGNRVKARAFRARHRV